MLQKHVVKEMGSKVGCFDGFYHHCLVTLSVHNKAQMNSGFWYPNACLILYRTFDYSLVQVHLSVEVCNVK